MIGVLVRWHHVYVDRVARELVHIQHGYVPLAEPPASRVQTMQFLVTTTVTEPPPDCAENTLRILRKEMRFCLGNNATVEPYHPFIPWDDTIPWDQPGADPMGDMRRVIKEYGPPQVMGQEAYEDMVSRSEADDG